MPDRTTRIAPCPAPRWPRWPRFPKRLARVARHDAKVLGTSARWLFTSREHHNYTYDLTPLNREHLAWFVSVVVRRAGRRRCAARSPRSTPTTRCARTSSRPPRRPPAAAWPTGRSATPAGSAGTPSCAPASRAHVVETGVDKGLGTCVLASALLRNAAEGHPGRVTSLGHQPRGRLPGQGRALAGGGRPGHRRLDRVDRRAGPPGRPVPARQRPQRRARAARVRRGRAASWPPGALLLTDNVTITNVLLEHAETTGRRFLAYRERPDEHWYPGDGIGVAW